MTDKIAAVARIRPGKRPDVERLLSQGPPFDLQAEGFERHEVFLEEEDVVFVFTGPGAMSQIERMAGSRALFGQVVKMAGLPSAPRLLTSTFEWQRGASSTAAAS